MATSRLNKALGQLQQALVHAGDSLSDRVLLERFLATRDEAAFELLVRRHGPMVLGVCRRLLRHAQDAEDAFQAVFLVLARRAGSVVRRDTVGGFLYGVAYRTALRARAAGIRRRQRERQVEKMPEPEVAAPEPQDWRPLLDHELSRLPEKYRLAVVLCDLEGLPRKEAARQLDVPEGTVSSRLTTGRQMLARRLCRRGLTLAGGALTTVLAEEASATVPSALALSTSKAAVLVAAGQLAALSTPAALLTKGVLKSMYVTRLKVVVAGIMIAGAVAAGGLAYRGTSSPGAVQAQTPPGKAGASKPRTEVEALRREVELLRLNLEVVLEKVRAQDAELRTLRGPRATGKPRTGNHAPPATTSERQLELTAPPTPPIPSVAVPPVPSPGENDVTSPVPVPSIRKPIVESPRRSVIIPPITEDTDPVSEVEMALKALRNAKNDAARRRALDQLEKAVRKLRPPRPVSAS